MFQLDPRLEQDTIALGKFELCLVLLHKDANFPWMILVPEREGITEIHQLSAYDQQLLVQESSLLAQNMETLFQPDSMNIAALGNIVSQLHIHHVARYCDDLAWPGPIWGAVPAKEYLQDELNQRLDTLKTLLAL